MRAKLKQVAKLLEMPQKEFDKKLEDEDKTFDGDAAKATDTDRRHSADPVMAAKVSYGYARI